MECEILVVFEVKYYICIADESKPVQIEGAVILSGSPGLEDTVARKIRRAKDDSRARSLITHGLQLFLNTWYSGGLWKRCFLVFFVCCTLSFYASLNYIRSALLVLLFTSILICIEQLEKPVLF